MMISISYYAFGARATVNTDRITPVLTTMIAHAIIVVFTLWRMTQRSQVAETDKVDFALTPLARTSTPETAALAVPDPAELSSEPDQ